MSRVWRRKERRIERCVLLILEYLISLLTNLEGRMLTEEH